MKYGVSKLAPAALSVWVTPPLMALAEAAEEHGHAPETFFGLPKWIWLTANLLLFLWLLARYIGKPIAGALEERGKSIGESLLKAEEQQKDAKGMKASLERQIAELKEEMDEVLARAQVDGEKERQEILAQADRERERILAQTDEEIAYRVAQAREQLTAHTAALAAGLAKQKLVSSIGPEDLDRLFDENLGRLERKAL